MSSLLNVSNASNEPEKFDLKDIEVFVDSEEQNWLEKGPCGEIFRDGGYSDIIESSVKSSLGRSSYQAGVVHWVDLDPKINKTRRINSSQPLGSCTSM